MLKRVKRRYLALKIASTEVFSSSEIIDVVWAAVLRLYGEYGASQANIVFVDYNKKTQVVVIRVLSSTLEMVRTAIASITKVGDKPAALHIVTVSGTIKALFKKMEALPRSTH